MIKVSRTRRQSAPAQPAPRPSRIRRDPPPIPGREKAVNPYPSEREVWVVVIGVVLFAIAIAIIIFGVSDYTSH